MLSALESILCRINTATPAFFWLVQRVHSFLSFWFFLVLCFTSSSYNHTANFFHYSIWQVFICSNSLAMSSAYRPLIWTAWVPSTRDKRSICSFPPAALVHLHSSEVQLLMLLKRAVTKIQFISGLQKEREREKERAEQSRAVTSLLCIVSYVPGSWQSFGSHISFKLHLTR